MKRTDFLPIEITLPYPEGTEYWDRLYWCAENIGKMMGSDDLEPRGRWFHYDNLDDDHIFCFADEEIASRFAIRFVFKFSE